MFMKANNSIRERINSNRLKNWEVAKEVGISDSRFSVWLRTPLNDERKARVEQAINNLLKKWGAKWRKQLTSKFLMS